MVVFSPFVLLWCTLWEPCARFFSRYSAFTDQKKKKKKSDLVVDESSIYLNLVVWILFLLVYSNLDRFLLTML